MTTTLTVTRTVDAPPSAAWAALARFGQIADWNPNLSGSFLLEESPSPQGVGTLRQCDMSDGKSWIRERVIDWQPGRSYTVDIYEGTLPLKSAEATLAVAGRDGDRCEVSMTLVYEPKLGLLGALMNALVMKSMMRKSMATLLRGLDESVRAAGEPARAGRPRAATS